MKLGIQVGSLDNGLISQGQDDALLTALFKARHLSRGTTGLEAPSDFIARNQRKCEMSKGSQLAPRVVLDLLINPFHHFR